jgi:SPP1 gp7 family putative phage head morphogenesis protein
MALRLEQEQRVLDDLKGAYSAAYDDIQSRLDELEKQITDIEAAGGDAASKIYQRDYQRRLQDEISPIVDAMRDGNEALVTQYLIDSYENGFIGAAYSFHGQGLPLNIPIDYRSVYNTVTTTNGGIPLSERLWKDTAPLKDRIRQEVSRGIASADSYANIARNLQKAMNTDMNKAYRIARTEAGRVTSRSSFDYAQKAKDMGADVLKQWSAFLDMRTRELHYMLHGQLRELEEPFDVLGMEGMYPGDFGAAAMDINCRCAMLQRARWALGKDELDRIGKPIESKGYKEFQGEYIKAANSTDPQAGVLSFDPTQYRTLNPQSLQGLSIGQIEQAARAQGRTLSEFEKNELWHRANGRPPVYATDKTDFTGNVSYGKSVPHPVTYTGARYATSDELIKASESWRLRPDGSYGAPKGNCQSIILANEMNRRGYNVTTASLTNADRYWARYDLGAGTDPSKHTGYVSAIVAAEHTRYGGGSVSAWLAGLDEGHYAVREQRHIYSVIVSHDRIEFLEGNGGPPHVVAVPKSDIQADAGRVDSLIGKRYTNHVQEATRLDNAWLDPDVIERMLKDGKA